MRHLAVFRTRLIVVALSAFMLVAVSCGSSSGGGSSSSSSSGSKPPVPKLTIGWLDVALAQTPIETRFYNTFKAAADHLGWTVKVTDLNVDVTKAEAGIEAFVNEHVDLIIDDSVEAALIRPGLLAAKQANIPVIGVGGSYADPSAFDGVYTEQEPPLATQLAQATIKDLQTSGGKKVGIVTSSSIASLKTRGDVAAGLFTAAGLNVVSTLDVAFSPSIIQDIQSKTAAMITANPDLSAIYSTFNLAAAPITTDVKQANLANQISVYSFYADPVDLPILEAPGSSLKAVVDGNLEVTSLYAADQILRHFVDGKPFGPQLPLSTFKYTIVTAQNAPPVTSNGVTPLAQLEAPYFQRWASAYTIPGT